MVLLWTQALYKSRICSGEGTGIESGAISINGNFQIVNPNGIPQAEGRHAAIFVEAQRHGIYGTLDHHSEVILKEDGSYSFKGKSGVLFRPARYGESVEEPWQTNSGEVPYQLDSIFTEQLG